MANKKLKSLIIIAVGTKEVDYKDTFKGFDFLLIFVKKSKPLRL